MELKDLTEEEQVALVALLELFIGADARVSEEEADRIDAVVAAIGEEAYRRAAAEVDRRLPEEEDIRAFVPSITRQAARETICGTVFGATTSGAGVPLESQLPEWLATAWDIPRRGRS